MSGRWYFKKLENIDGLIGIKIVLINSGFGKNEKRIKLFKSLNRKYMTIPIKRVNNDNKP